MRNVARSILLFAALSVVRLVGCGDERIPCETSEECDDNNECTDDVCSLGYCRSTEVGYGSYNPLPFFCDLDGVEQFYEDGVCVSRTCERRESPTDQYMCADYICKPGGDVYPLRNRCTNDIYDEGTCAFVLEPNSASCCAGLDSFNCSIGGGCDYRCTEVGACQDGQCCVGERCYESRPWGYGCNYGSYSR